MLVRNKMSEGTQKCFNNDQKKKKKRISQKRTQVDDDSGRWMLLSQSSDRLARRSKPAIKILLIHEALKFLLLIFCEKDFDEDRNWSSINPFP